MDYTIGQADSKVPLPNFLVEPDCGFEPSINNIIVQPGEDLPEGTLLEKIVDFDKTTMSFIVKRNENFEMIGKKVAIFLTLDFIDFDGDAVYKLFINYQTKGPEFANSNIDIPDITCSAEDEKWEFVLPKLKLADKLTEVTITQIETSLINYFSLDQDSGTVTLNKDLVQGKIECPDQK